MNYIDNDYRYLNNFISKISNASDKLFSSVTIQRYSNSDFHIYFPCICTVFYVPSWAKRIMLEQFSEETQERINKTLDYMDSLNIFRVENCDFRTSCFIKAESIEEVIHEFI